MSFLKSFQKKAYKNKEISVISAGVLAYIVSLCTLPSSGIWTSLPVAFLLSLAAGLLCRSYAVIYAMMTVMPLLLNLLYGFELSHAVIAAVYGLASAVLAVLAKRAVHTAKVSKKKGNADVYVKSMAVLCVAVLAGIAVWLFCFGNPVSALVNRAENKEYVYEKYGESVKCGYTYYDAVERKYLTEISFDGAETGENYYVSAGSTDGYFDFCIGKVYVEAQDYFERQTTVDADTVKCYIDGNGLAVSADMDYRDCLDKCEYLLEIPEIVTDMGGFKRVYENVSDFIEMSDTFVYKSITVCAKDSEGISYFAHKNYGKNPEFLQDSPEYEKMMSEKFDK